MAEKWIQKAISKPGVAAMFVKKLHGICAGELVIRRQALRDIPSQADFPWDVQWPTQPE